jgi:cobalt/nickel transport protein
MEMGAPKQFGVMLEGKKTSLLDSLKEIKVQGKRAYELLYKFKSPGDYIFFIEPAPYWEPAEQKMIVHYTKVIVDVLGAESGWDEMVGFPVEIEPLSRPYSLYTGNIFQGIVKKNGKPVPFAEVEVELYNKDKAYEAPADVFVTQVIKADANGVFSYAIPKSGWWGFAALIDGDKKMKNPKGKEVDVELGAVIWVKVVDMKKIK